MSDDDDLPPRAPRHRFDIPPQLVCLDCGKGVFGSIIKPFNLIDGQECEICARPTQVVHGSVFEGYAEMFFKRDRKP